MQETFDNTHEDDFVPFFEPMRRQKPQKEYSEEQKKRRKKDKGWQRTDKRQQLN